MLNNFSETFAAKSCSLIDRLCNDIQLDADSTKGDSYVSQEEGSAGIHRCSQVGYHPFVVNEFSTRLLAGTWLRTGESYSAVETCSLIKSIRCRLPRKEERIIHFRGDAAFFCSSKLMELSETWNFPILYTIRAYGIKGLHDVCITHYSQSSPFYGELCYQITGSTENRRVCHKLWFSEDEDKNGQICRIPNVLPG